MTPFEESLRGECSVCGRRTFFDPCPACAEAARSRSDTSTTDAVMLALREKCWSFYNKTKARAVLPSGVAAVPAIQPLSDPFDDVHLPTPPEIRRLMVKGWDEDSEIAQRLCRRNGSRYCRMWGIRPFHHGEGN